MPLSRRDLLKLAVVGGAAMTLPLERLAATSRSADRLPASKLPRPFTLPFRTPPELTPSGTAPITCFDGVERSYPHLQVTQTFTVTEILPGYRTPVFAYNGSVPGPTIRVRHGVPVLVDQLNLLHRPPAPPYAEVPMPSRYTSDPMRRTTSTHLHGSASLPQYDGYASDVTAPGQMKRYFYPNSQEARMLWYHDHAVHHTSQNAYNGLAGLYLIQDDIDDSLQLPKGRYDVPLLVRDAMFGTDGGLVYDDNSESGVYGDVILVNGVPWPEMVVERRKYRFRMLNASVARSYSWSLSDGRSRVPMTVVATDSGLVPKPQTVSSFRQAVGERVEIVIDFAKFRDDARLTLLNASPKNNVDYDSTKHAMRFRVRGDASSTDGNTIPANWEQLVPKAECMTWTEAGLRAQGVRERRFDFGRRGGEWTINEETWKDVVDSDYRRVVADPGVDDIEIWELRNLSGGWFHPVHVHLVDFQILSRNGSAAKVPAYERGPKDVVYLGENESVKVAMRFGAPSAGEGWPRPRGRYMMHCHNLVHEDHDMMVQFNVGDPGFAPELDPMTAAAPVALP